MKKTTWLKLISVAVPYLAVLVGLYILKNAWIAIGFYHFGIVLFLIAGDRNSLQGISWVFFMIYFSTVQPFLEELYWRDYLGSNQKYLSWTDLAFAGYHIFVLVWFIKLPWLVISFLVLTMAASGWRYVSNKFEGLSVPLLSHIVVDISIVAATNLLIE